MHLLLLRPSLTNHKGQADLKGSRLVTIALHFRQKSTLQVLLTPTITLHSRLSPTQEVLLIPTTALHFKLNLTLEVLLILTTILHLPVIRPFFLLSPKASVSSLNSDSSNFLCSLQTTPPLSAVQTLDRLRPTR